MILETDRLFLRAFQASDASDIFKMVSDPKTMEFMDNIPQSMDQVVSNIEFHQRHYNQYGFGLWAIILKETGSFVGRCGLLHQELEGVPEVEVAYMIDRSQWGKGLATEAALAIVKYARDILKKKRLISLIVPKNMASIKVAERIGMTLEKSVNYKGSKTLLYSIEK